MVKRYRRKGKKLSSQVYKNKRFLKKLAKGIENKCKWTSVVNRDVNTTTDGTNIQCLNQMKKGTNGYGDGVTAGQELRVGDRINGKRITIKGYISNAHGTPGDVTVRIILFRSKHPNNAQQSIDLLLGSNPYITTLYYPPHAERFQVLFDKTISMDTNLHTVVPWYFTTKINTVTAYNGNAGTYADIEHNGYYLAAYSTVAGTANDPYLSYDCHFWFEDA